MITHEKYDYQFLRVFHIIDWVRNIWHNYHIMAANNRIPILKPIEWASQAKKELKEFPDDVIDVIGYSLMLVQQGEKPDNAKPLKGFAGAGVLEVIEDFDSDTYRAIYTVRFKKAIYVLCAFKKKSKEGIKTPKKDMDLIKHRLDCAAEHYKSKYGT